MRFLVDLRIWIFVPLLFLLQNLRGQQIQVLDRETRHPIAEVAVYNSERNKVTLTDSKGLCLLDIFDTQEPIYFQHMGYRIKRITKEQAIRKGVLLLDEVVEQLNEVVMSISKWEQQKRNIPQQVTSVNAAQIAFNQPQTAADLLASTAKIFVQKSQLGGGSPMIRGYAANRVMLSVDGVRMNNAIFRGGNLQNVIAVDPFSVEQAEILFGPGSVIYGSDAIGGVMNFITQAPEYAQEDSTLVQGRGSYRFASANTENTVHAKVGVGWEKWAILSSLSFNSFGDMRMGKHGPEEYLRTQYVERNNGQDVLVRNSNPRQQHPSGYKQYNLMQKMRFKPNRNWELGLDFHYSTTADFDRYDRLIRPSSDGQGLRSAAWYYGPQSWLLGSIWAQQIAKNKFYDGLKVAVAYQRFGESRHDRNFGNPVLWSTEEVVDAFSANVDFENKRKNALRLYYGAEYVYNLVHSSGSRLNIETNSPGIAPSRYPDGATWNSMAAYVSGEYKGAPNLTLMGGLRYNQVCLRADYDSSFYPFPFQEAQLNNGAFTGSLGLSWFPKTNWQFTSNLSTGFRAPNIDDVGKVFDSEPGSVVVPNPNLEPEYVYNAEIGIKHSIRDLAVLRAAVYYSYLDKAMVRRDYTFNGQDSIVYNGEPSKVQAIQNAAMGQVYGLELGASIFFSDQWSATGNLTFTKGTVEEDSGARAPARHAAPTFGDLHLLWNRDKIKVDFFLNYNGEVANRNLAPSEQAKAYMYAVDANGEPYSPSWYTLNLRSQYQWTDKLRLSFAWENITNQRYRPYSSGIAAAGINWLLGIDYYF